MQRIECTETAETATRKAHLQFLPCRIDYSGPAKVSTYFFNENAADKASSTATNENEGKPLKTTFRGRELMGLNARLPDGYEGRIYNDETGRTAVAADGKATKKQDPVIYNNDGNAGKDGNSFLVGEEAGEIRKWRAIASFDQIIVWEHDMPPSELTSNHLRMLEIIRVAELMVSTIHVISSV